MPSFFHTSEGIEIWPCTVTLDRAIAMPHITTIVGPNAPLVDLVLPFSYPRLSKSYLRPILPFKNYQPQMDTDNTNKTAPLLLHEAHAGQHHAERALVAGGGEGLVHADLHARAL